MTLTNRLLALLCATSLPFAAPHITFNQGRAVRDQTLVTCRQVVESDRLLAGVEQRQQHVRADIARSAGYKYAHNWGAVFCMSFFPRIKRNTTIAFTTRV